MFCEVRQILLQPDTLGGSLGSPLLYIVPPVKASRSPRDTYCPHCHKLGKILKKCEVDFLGALHCSESKVTRIFCAA